MLWLALARKCVAGVGLMVEIVVEGLIIIAVKLFMVTPFPFEFDFSEEAPVTGVTSFQLGSC